MKNILIIFSLITIFLVSCKKEYGASSVVVEVNYDNEYLYQMDKDFSNQKVFVNTDSTSTDYVYEFATDEKGKANVNALKQETPYYIFASATIDTFPIKGGFQITIPKEVDKTTATLTLQPDESKFNGISFSAQDNLGNGVAGVNICFYLSEELADSSACDYASFSGKTDLYGNFNRFFLEADTYYYSVRDTIAGTFVNLSGEIDVSATGVAKKTVQLF